jgi:hypothetical protein
MPLRNGLAREQVIVATHSETLPSKTELLV